MLKGKLSLVGLAQVTIIIVFASSTLALFDTLTRYFELLSHFRFQYFVIAMVSLCVFVKSRSLAYGSISAVVLMHNSVAVLPWYFHSVPDSNDGKLALRILQSNVKTENTHYDRFLAVANSASADLISLQEVNDDWLAKVESLKEQYPFFVVSPREDNFGIAVFSKQPFIETEVVEFGQSGVPSIVVTFAFQGKTVTLISTHPLPPVSDAYFNDRNAQLSDLASWIQRTANPTIVVGDLNVSMWSSYYTAFVESASLENARKGFGILSTWPSNMPFLSIPIDHILVSKEFSVSSAVVGENVGSDHKPFIATVDFE